MVGSTSLRERHMEDINTISQSWPDTARILSELMVAMDSFAQKQDGMELLFTQLIKEKGIEYSPEGNSRFRPESNVSPLPYFSDIQETAEEISCNATEAAKASTKTISDNLAKDSKSSNGDDDLVAENSDDKNDDICCIDKTGALTSNDMEFSGIGGLKVDKGLETETSEVPDWNLEILVDHKLVGDPLEMTALKRNDRTYKSNENATPQTIQSLLSNPQYMEQMHSTPEGGSQAGQNMVSENQMNLNALMDMLGRHGAGGILRIIFDGIKAFEIILMENKDVLSPNLPNSGICAVWHVKQPPGDLDESYQEFLFSELLLPLFTDEAIFTQDSLNNSDRVWHIPWVSDSSRYTMIVGFEQAGVTCENWKKILGENWKSCYNIEFSMRQFPKSVATADLSFIIKKLLKTLDLFLPWSNYLWDSGGKTCVIGGCHYPRNAKERKYLFVRFEGLRSPKENGTDISPYAEYFYELKFCGAKVQVMTDARKSDLGEEEFTIFHSAVKRGDIVGIIGFPGKSKRGELSIFPKIFVLLFHCPHMMPSQKIGPDTDNKVITDVRVPESARNPETYILKDQETRDSPYRDPDSIRGLFGRALAYVVLEIPNQQMIWIFGRQKVKMKMPKLIWAKKKNWIFPFSHWLQFPAPLIIFQQLERYFNGFKELVASQLLLELRTAEEAAAAISNSEAIGQENEEGSNAIDRLQRGSSGRISYIVVVKHKHDMYAALLSQLAPKPLTWSSPLKIFSELNSEFYYEDGGMPEQVD